MLASVIWCQAKCSVIMKATMQPPWSVWHSQVNRHYKARVVKLGMNPVKQKNQITAGTPNTSLIKMKELKNPTVPIMAHW